MLEIRLAEYGAVPISHGALLPLLAEYRRPNDKIAEWMRQGVLIPIKRGLYLVGTPWRQEPVCLPLVANHLYGPSCVSLDYALAWHGLIPERVHEVTSTCMRRGRVVTNALGRFSYSTVPAALFPVGMTLERQEKVSFLMAGPEKALCEKVLVTRRLEVTSKAAMEVFLFEDLRLDDDALGSFDLAIVEHFVKSGHKSRQMQALWRVLESLQ